jgi:hypothetical protein
MSTEKNPGGEHVANVSCQAFLDNWRIRVAATVKESLTVQFFGSQKLRKDRDGNFFLSDFFAFCGRQRGLV